MEDFSMHHHPTGTLLGPQLRRNPDCFRLSADQVNFFHERGYVSGLRVLLDEQVETLRKELADLTDPKHPGHALFMNITRTNQPFQITFCSML